MEQEEVYYEEEFYEDNEEFDTIGAALKNNLKSAPWYFYSFTIHCVLFLLMIIFAPVNIPEKGIKTIIISEIIERNEEEIIEYKEPEPLTEITKTDQTEVEIKTEVEVTTEVGAELENEVTEEPTKGDPSDFSDLSNDVSSPALMGIGARGGEGGKGGGFGARRGTKKGGLVRRKGGDTKTVESVNWALKWLAYHQEADGHWDNKKYEGTHEDKPVEDKQFDVAVTSLALLAFLGDGHSSKFGKFKKNVAAAEAWLVSQQQPNGQIGRNFKYEAALGLMAIVESYGMSEDSNMKVIAQQAVNHAIKSQNETGGFDYVPNSVRTDTSPTSFWFLGLKSARVAKLNIQKKTFENLSKWYDYACRDDGKVLYALKNGQESNTGSATMASAGLCCRLFLGYPKNDAKILAIADGLISQKFGTQNGPLPTMQEDPNMTKYYLWYYEALAFYQMGTESNYWKIFNPLMKKQLVPTQRMDGTVSQYKGSWNPPKIGDNYWHGCGNWGRVGQTAMSALMLEVYYRYEETK